jgi:hypothetical protein
MKLSKRVVSATLLLTGGLILTASSAQADDQTKIGAGNPAAIALAKKSPMVNSAYAFLLSQAAQIKDATLRKQTLDALGDDTCVHHRAGLTDAKKDAIIQTLTAQGLVNSADAASIQGGVKAGIFPPVVNDGTACPKLPQKFFSAPGSTSVFGHHSYPGGLVVHESNNETADLHLATEYREIYGHSGRGGFPTVAPDDVERSGGFGNSDHHGDRNNSDIFIDQDIIIGAPLWHDWAKPIVFQWNADGTEFMELNFGGAGSVDNFGGTAGDSRTGGHHIITIAEEMSRGLSPAFVITQASAHSAPTSGNEYKVVNWLRAGAIVAGIDPVAKGYLNKDASGNLRLPALRQLGDDLDLIAAGQTNVLAEYTLHNLSDADFTYSGPAIDIDNVLLQELAPLFGHSATDADYFTNFRNPVLSFFTAERLSILYSEKGIDGVRAEVQKLRDQKII